MSIPALASIFGRLAHKAFDLPAHRELPGTVAYSFKVLRVLSLLCLLGASFQVRRVILIC